MIRTYRDFVVWQKGLAFVTYIYDVTRSFPKEEMFELTSQMRRCAVSIPSNIAEGFGRKGNDFLRFLRFSIGSLYELQTQMEIALNLEYLSQAAYEKAYESSREIERMLSSLIQRLCKTSE